MNDSTTPAAAAGVPGQPSPAPAKKPFTASAFQIHVWGSTNISYTFQYQLFNPLVNLIFNLGFGMDPRIIGWALFFPRLIDAFVDPAVGHLSDITRTRWGRRRPFMMVCSILAAFLGVMLWQADRDWHWFAQVAYLCVFVTFYFIVVMTFELTRNALSYELSDDYSGRSKVMAVAGLWSAIPQLFGSVTYIIVLKLAKGGAMDLGIPSFRIGWAAGLAAWLGGAILFAAWLGGLMLKGHRPAVRLGWAAAVLALLLAAPAGTAYALHGVAGTRAMIHSWSDQKPAPATAPTTAPSTAPATAPSTGPASAPSSSQASAPASAPASSTGTVLDVEPAIAAEAPRAHRGNIAPMAAASRPAPPSMPTDAPASAPAAGIESAKASVRASAATFTYGLDYPGFTFVSIHFPNLGSEVKGIRVVSLFIGGIIIFFGVVPTLFIKERFQNYNRKHVGLWRAFGATLRNRPFVVTILLRLCQTLGSSFYSNTIAVYLLIYLVCRGNKEEFTTVMAIVSAWVSLGFSLLIWPLAAPLTRMIGKKWGLVLGFGSALALAIVTPFLLRPGWIWVVLATNIFFMPWGMLQGVFFSSVQPDICDLDEVTSGERREGLYSAVYSFINKLEISVIFLLAGYLLHWAGFDTAAASKGIMPAESVIRNLMWMGLAPLILFSVLAFVIAFFYSLTPDVMAKVHAELEARRARSHLVAPDVA